MAPPVPSNFANGPFANGPFGGGPALPPPPPLPMQMPTIGTQQQQLPMPGDYNGMGQGVRQALSYYLMGGLGLPGQNPGYPTQQAYQSSAPQAPSPGSQSTTKGANQSLSSGTEGAMTDYRAQATSYATQYGLDPTLFTKQIQAESGFDPNAQSPAGALGIAQFMPATAQGMGVDPTNATQSLDGAARLMASYLKQYGNYPLALAAYNAGPGNVQKYLNGTADLPDETKRYIQEITGQRL